MLCRFLKNIADFSAIFFYSFSRKYVASISAVESAKQKLVVAAIAEKAGIKLSDEDVKAAAEAEYEDWR